MLQIKHILHRKPGKISGGQQQRAAIARALAKQPQLLLLDEPFSNVDARLRLELREELRHIQQLFGITTLFVTHDQDEAMCISDYIMHIANGRLLQFGTPPQLYNEPVCREVAEFVGNPPMNMLPIQSERLIMGFRPDDGYLSGPDTALLTGRVTAIEMTGRDVLLKLRCKEVKITIIAPRDVHIRIGQEIHIGVREDRLHWFDAMTGQRVNLNRSPHELQWAGVNP